MEGTKCLGKKQVVFIIGPYRSNKHNGVWENVNNARSLAVEFWKYGYAVVCPQLNSAFFGGACDEDNFLVGYQEILSRCDFYALVDGWEFSEGSKGEVDLAKRLGLVEISIFDLVGDE